MLAAVAGRLRRRRIAALIVVALTSATLVLGLRHQNRVLSSLSGGLQYISPYGIYASSSSSSSSRITMDQDGNTDQRRQVPLAYGTAARPPLKDLPPDIIADMPAEYLPRWPVPDDQPRRRLVIVGDVHGQKNELEALLKKLDFDVARGDHLVLTGDMVNKGPDSPGVVALAMELGASAVRGNHEDRVLLAHAAMERERERKEKKKKKKGKKGKKKQLAAREEEEEEEEKDKDEKETATTEEEEEEEEEDPESPPLGGSWISSIFGGKDKNKNKDKDKAKDESKNPPKEGEEEEEPPQQTSRGDEADRATALSLSPSQLAWLSSLPLVLRAGALPSSPLENLAVVHAGLVPGLALEKQDPWAVMNMRSFARPLDDLWRERIRGELAARARARIAASRSRSRSRGKARGGNGRSPSPPLVHVPPSLVEAEFRRQKSLYAHAPVPGEEVVVPVDGHPSSGSNSHTHLEAWAPVWSRYQRDEVAAGQRLTVAYGHDAKAGLVVPRARDGSDAYAFGLDSGCVYGRKLSALVIEPGARGLEHRIVQVKCAKAAQEGS